MRSKVGHSFIKKTMRDENIPFGGEHSGQNKWRGAHPDAGRHGRTDRNQERMTVRFFVAIALAGAAWCQSAGVHGRSANMHAAPQRPGYLGAGVVEVTPERAKALKLTEARWQRFTRLLKQYEGWSSSLRAVHGHDMVQFLEESSLLGEQIIRFDSHEWCDLDVWPCRAAANHIARLSDHNQALHFRGESLQPALSALGCGIRQRLRGIAHVNEPMLAERKIALPPLVQCSVDALCLVGGGGERRHSLPPRRSHGLRGEQAPTRRMESVLKRPDEFLRGPRSSSRGGLGGLLRWTGATRLPCAEG